MIGWLLAFRAAGAAVRPLRPSEWKPADNDVDLAGGLFTFALLLLVLIVGTAALALQALGRVLVGLYRLVTR